MYFLFIYLRKTVSVTVKPFKFVGTWCRLIMEISFIGLDGLNSCNGD